MHALREVWAEQLLHHPHVGAALEQVGGERMPQHVRRHPRGDPGALGHASVTTTQIYTMVTVHALREVWAEAHPRAR
ncbi:hypothetical protein MAHJHV33_49790 [Mycobacterium avium subsp. hominissuis]